MSERACQDRYWRCDTPITARWRYFAVSEEWRTQNGQADPSQDRAWLTRALLPLATGAANADRLEAAARLERDTAGI